MDLNLNRAHTVLIYLIYLVTSFGFNWLLSHSFLPFTDSIEHVTFSSSQPTFVTMDRVPLEADLKSDLFASVEFLGSPKHLPDTSLREALSGLTDSSG